MLLGCSSQTEFFMRLFNLEGSVGPVKETELKPHQCAFELSSDKLFQLLVGAYLCMYSCFRAAELANSPC